MTDGAILAYDAVLKLATNRHEFTADDLATAMGESYPRGEARSVFMRAERMGVIERTNVFVRSKRKKQHGQPRRVWRSMLLGRPASVDGCVWVVELNHEPLLQDGRIVCFLADEDGTSSMRAFLNTLPTADDKSYYDARLYRDASITTL